MFKQVVTTAALLLCALIVMFLLLRMEKSLCDVDYSIYYGCETLSNEMLLEDALEAR